MDYTWHCKSFDDLTKLELYHILQLRVGVFIVEQYCPYPDLDDKDFQSYHFFATANTSDVNYNHSKNPNNNTNELLGYVRLMPIGLSYEGYASVGRVLVAHKGRGSQLGKLLMERALQQIEVIWGRVPIKISAQAYLVNFYKKFGFEPFGQPYLEDAIPHMGMIRPI